MACERVISAKRQTDQGKRTGGEGAGIFRDVVNFQQRPKGSEAASQEPIWAKGSRNKKKQVQRPCMKWEYTWHI